MMSDYVIPVTGDVEADLVSVNRFLSAAKNIGKFGVNVDQHRYGGEPIPWLDPENVDEISEWVRGSNDRQWKEVESLASPIPVDTEAELRYHGTIELVHDELLDVPEEKRDHCYYYDIKVGKDHWHPELDLYDRLEFIRDNHHILKSNAPEPDLNKKVDAEFEVSNHDGGVPNILRNKISFLWYKNVNERLDKLEKLTGQQQNHIDLFARRITLLEKSGLEPERKTGPMGRPLCPKCGDEEGCHGGCRCGFMSPEPEGEAVPFCEVAFDVPFNPPESTKERILAETDYSIVSKFMSPEPEVERERDEMPSAANARRRDEAISMISLIFSNEGASSSDRLIYLQDVGYAVDRCIDSIRELQTKET